MNIRLDDNNTNLRINIGSSKPLLAIFMLVFWVCSFSYAQDTDDQEKPDPLLDVTTDEKTKKYGDSNVVIQVGGEKDSSQLKPDPLEKSLAEKSKISEKKISYEKIIKTDKKKIKKELHTKGDSDQQTPDPLLNTVDD